MADFSGEEYRRSAGRDMHLTWGFLLTLCSRAYSYFQNISKIRHLVDSDNPCTPLSSFTIRHWDTLLYGLPETLLSKVQPARTQLLVRCKWQSGARNVCTIALAACPSGDFFQDFDTYMQCPARHCSPVPDLFSWSQPTRSLYPPGTYCCWVSARLSWQNLPAWLLDSGMHPLSACVNPRLWMRSTYLSKHSSSRKLIMRE